MYCGNCFRDNALVRVWRALGHSALMIPLYLPLTLEEEDQSAGMPIFFSGINVYLEQQLAIFRKAPPWLRRLFASPTLLKWASGQAAKTRAEELGDVTLSMLRGEQGNQACELTELANWLKSQPCIDVICLSNALLLGLARRLKRELGAPVVCMLQGEDSFLNALPEPQRGLAWKILAERAAEMDLFIAPSRYFADLMRPRLGLAPEQVRVVYNGINVEGFSPAPDRDPSAPPVLGYFARMCREKGLDTLVQAYLILKERNRVKNLKLRIGGGLGPADEATLVKPLRETLLARGVMGDVEFCPNLNRAAKLAFYRSLTVFSVPALYGEAFGLYVIEALAAGVPVVQPRHAAFPELIEATGGGLLCEPSDPAALASAIEELLLNPARACALGTAGRQAVLEQFSVEQMAQNILKLLLEVPAGRSRHSLSPQLSTLDSQRS